MKRALILASTSPRRRTLLSELGIPFTVCAPTLAEERLDPARPLAEALEALALEKARSVACRFPEALVLGADTIVCKDGVLLGKPHDAQDAAHMLRSLSGSDHDVITAVALCVGASNQAVSNHAVSTVRFRKLTEEAYIATGEPLDKAGAYGIQGEGGRFVSALDGPFDNVVGLPLALVREMLDGWEEEV